MRVHGLPATCCHGVLQAYYPSRQKASRSFVLQVWYCPRNGSSDAKACLHHSLGCVECVREEPASTWVCDAQARMMTAQQSPLPNCQMQLPELPCSRI